ncbi:MAG: hypothetical protein RPG89_09885 [Microcystis panniformis WG22]|nr:hypothetical protein [Microcystis panniformis WG22]
MSATNKEKWHKVRSPSLQQETHPTKSHYNYYRYRSNVIILLDG